MKSYFDFAKGKMELFQKELDKALEGINDKKKIHDDFISILAVIDVRLLDINTQAGYNELFSTAYQNLDDEQKVPLTLEMAARSKRKLCFF